MWTPEYISAGCALATLLGGVVIAILLAPWRLHETFERVVNDELDVRLKGIIEKQAIFSTVLDEHLREDRHNFSELHRHIDTEIKAMQSDFRTSLREMLNDITENMRRDRHESKNRDQTVTIAVDQVLGKVEDMRNKMENITVSIERLATVAELQLKRDGAGIKA